MWAMHVTGATTTHVAVLLPFLEFREYVIEYDPAEGEFIERQCAMFMDTLARQVPPPLDGATSTYQTLRELHPEINGESVEIEPAHAYNWLKSRDLLEGAKLQEQRQRNLIVNAMGSAQKAVHNGWTLGSRISKSGGTPYFSPARSLPTPEQVLTPREGTS
jgi:hypothetical protein